MGYSLDEIQGQHHSLFVEPALRQQRRVPASSGPDSAAASSQTGEFKRVGKGGTEVWIQGAYNPILDRNGQPFKVVKYATDVTEQVKLRLDIQRC